MESGGLTEMHRLAGLLVALNQGRAAAAPHRLIGVLKREKRAAKRAGMVICVTL